MPGVFALDQGGEIFGGNDFLDLGGVEEAGQGVGHAQRRVGVHAAVLAAGEARAGENVRVIGHQPRQLEPATQGRDGGRQVEGQIARLKRRLAFVQITERENLRQEHRASPSRADEGLRKSPRTAPGGQEHHCVGEGVGIVAAQGVEQGARQIAQERPVRVDGEPSRRGSVEEGGAAHWMFLRCSDGTRKGRSVQNLLIPAKAGASRDQDVGWPMKHPVHLGPRLRGDEP